MALNWVGGAVRTLLARVDKLEAELSVLHGNAAVPISLFDAMTTSGTMTTAPPSIPQPPQFRQSFSHVAVEETNAQQQFTKPAVNIDGAVVEAGNISSEDDTVLWQNLAGIAEISKCKALRSALSIDPSVDAPWLHLEHVMDELLADLKVPLLHGDDDDDAVLDLPFNEFLQKLDMWPRVQCSDGVFVWPVHHPLLLPACCKLDFQIQLVQLCSDFYRPHHQFECPESWLFEQIIAMEDHYINSVLSCARLLCLQRVVSTAEIILDTFDPGIDDEFGGSDCSYDG